MNVAWLQHVEHEDLGSIAPWLIAHGYSLQRCALHQGEALPALSSIDGLIVLGGPMNVDEHDQYPWLPREKAFIAAAIAAGKRVLGICLGAQLIAAALGATVRRNAHTEIGWHTVRLSEQGQRHPALAGFGQVFETFHWHGDTFDLPANAVCLMSSEACSQQAFCIGEQVLGLQFHLEVTAANLREWFAVERPIPSTYVQTAEECVHDLKPFALNQQLMHRLLTNLDRLWHQPLS